jgi:hypothetical protein
VVVQPDGKILVGGEFTMLGGGGRGTTIACANATRPSRLARSIRRRKVA